MVNTVTTEYALDPSPALRAGLASGLTQVLADSDGNAYLYGVRRIGEEGNDGWIYHHGDALGSVRQLTDATGTVTLAKGYQPRGEVLSSNGDGTVPYDYATINFPHISTGISGRSNGCDNVAFDAGYSRFSRSAKS